MWLFNRPGVEGVIPYTLLATNLFTHLLLVFLQNLGNYLNSLRFELGIIDRLFPKMVHLKYETICKFEEKIKFLCDVK